MNLTENGKRRLRLIWGIVTSALLVISGLLFIISCYLIYKSGESPFTRASIAEAFSKIAVPVYLTLLAAAGSIVLAVCFPDEGARLVGKRTELLVMKKLYSRVNVAELADETRLPIEREEKLRRIMQTVNIALFVLSGVLPLVYLLNPSNFPAVTGEYNSEIGKGMIIYLCCLLPLFVYEIVYVIIRDRSVIRETEMLREAIKNSPSVSAENTEKDGGVFRKTRKFIEENQKPILLGVRIAFVGCAIGFVIAGVFNGGAADVLQKAIKICTECIGLG